MSNSLYPSAKQGFIGKVFNMDTDDIKMSLIKLLTSYADGYAYNSAHDEYSGVARDVPASAIVAESAALTNTTIVNGVFDSDNFTFTSVTGDTCGALIQWDDTLSPDRLILYLDQGVTGLPVVPNGGTIAGTVDSRGFWALIFLLLAILPSALS